MTDSRDKIYRFGEFRLDVRQRVLEKNGTVIKLPQKTFELLLFFVENSNIVVEKDRLMNSLWPETFVEDANLTVRISHLRKLFHTNGNNSVVIETFPKVGYRFGADISVESRFDAPPVDTGSRSSNVGEAENAVPVVVSDPRPKRRRPIVLAPVMSLAVGLVVLIFVAAMVVPGPQSRSGPLISSIAVLPFKNLTDAPDSEFLSEGLTEMLIRQLSQRPGLSVKARSSVFRYKGTETDPVAAGRELSAQAVVVGRMTLREQEFVFDVEVIDVASNNVLWTQVFQRSERDLPKIADEISSEIFLQLNVGESAPVTSEKRVAREVDSEAYSHYLRGRHFWNRRTNEDFRKAVEFFQRAIEIEPDFALAYSGLSDSYALLIAFGGVAPEDVLLQAKSTAQKAIELDPNLAEGHASVGNVAFIERDQATAEREFRKAIDLNPNYATAHQWLAELLSGGGKYDDADVSIRRALELDPLSRIIRNIEARNHFWAGRNDKAIALLKRNIELDPTWGGDHDLLFHVYEANGMHAEAVDAYLTAQSLLKATPEDEIRLTRQSFDRKGWQGFVKRRIQFLEDPARGYVRPMILAEFYARAGDLDRSFAALERVGTLKTLAIAWIQHLAAYEELRKDPRYPELVRKWG